jgi:Cytochrome c554 and c-prime
MMPRRGTRRLAFTCLVASCLLFAPFTHFPALVWAQSSTEDRLLYPGWWPRHSTPSANEYVGPAECAKCHPGKAASQKTTSMARTAARTTGVDATAEPYQLTFRVGQIQYQIKTVDGKISYSVADGAREISAPLTWFFGDGHIGQSYLFERQGNFYESRVSYFGLLRALDFTPGRKLTEPRDLEQAMARPVDGAELVRCFSCHTTSSTIAGKFDRGRTIPGITCEACHGPGLTHAATQEIAYVQGQAWEDQQETELIFDPGKLNPFDAVDFCGACHGTWSDVKMAPPVGIANVRAQPYRLEKSRCWGKNGDSRLICVACHDPHQELVRDSASYDKNCLACHVTVVSAKPTSDHPGLPCKVATTNCASCHMPKYELADFHYRFTDHDIRVVRPGAPYPE